MRICVVLAIATAFAGPASAQAPASEVVPAVHKAPAPSFWSALCCEPPKVCVRVPDKKKETKVTYGCKSEDFCLPRCPHLFAALFHKKGCCDQCLDCEKPRKKNLLIKYIREEECDVLKCKPVAAPCEPACSAPRVAPKGEVAPELPSLLPVR